MPGQPLTVVADLPSTSLDRQLSRRLRRIEGQVRGVQGMIAERRELPDVLAQLLAIQSATRAAIDLIERERLVQQVKMSIQRALSDCVGHCDLCDQLAGLTDALNGLHAASFAAPSPVRQPVSVGRSPGTTSVRKFEEVST